jgi:nitronate monooxygenase
VKKDIFCPIVQEYSPALLLLYQGHFPLHLYLHLYLRFSRTGFIQGGRAFKPESSDLPKLEVQLTETKSLLQDHSPAAQGGDSNNSDSSHGLLPVGVGFVLFSECAASHFGQTTVPILARHRPAAVWLFAPDPSRPETLGRVVDDLRSQRSSSGWDPRIVVQVGTVAAAREAASVGADVIVAQGVDAGGHGFVNAGSFVSLVPEIRDMLRAEFPDSEISVWAAGGIADGR